MTIPYSAEVATVRGLGNFPRLLRRWKGSIYKIIWLDFLLYSITYAGISCLYRFYLKKPGSEEANKVFIQMVHYCKNFNKTIPLSFILGFYVSNVVSRWWAQFTLLPWPDSIATLISTNLQGEDERGRLMRRTMMRYLNLSYVVTMGMMSTPAKNRFPTLQHLVESGFLLPHELLIIENLNEKTKHPKYWVPIVWAGGILSRARREGRIPDDMSMNEIIVQLTKWRNCLGDLLGYDWASLPLMYTQTVTLAVYLYSLAALLGKQFIDDGTIDLYVPIFTLCEFFFYMGWLRVAETLVNPFGEDDDDFEINWLIDRNLQVSYLIADEMHSEHPPMLKDQYWDEVGRVEAPYTEEAAARFKRRTEGITGSTRHITVSKDEAEFLTDEEMAVRANAYKLTQRHSLTRTFMDDD